MKTYKLILLFIGMVSVSAANAQSQGGGGDAYLTWACGSLQANGATYRSGCMATSPGGLLASLYLGVESVGETYLNSNCDDWGTYYNASSDSLPAPGSTAILQVWFYYYNATYSRLDRVNGNATWTFTGGGGGNGYVGPFNNLLGPCWN